MDIKKENHKYSEWNTPFLLYLLWIIPNTDLLQNGPSNFSALPIDQSNILFDNIENPTKEEEGIVEREEDSLDLGGDADALKSVEDSLLGIIIYFPLSQIIIPITIWDSIRKKYHLSKITSHLKSSC